MKVLIISHNAIGDYSNMGKTLKQQFYGWDTTEIAQVYFHPGTPSFDLCNNYYQFTDIDAFKSIFSHNITGKSVIQEQVIENNHGKTIEDIYQAGRSRSPFIYIARDLLWHLSNWKNPNLIEWVEDFSPDLIFFAAGDYEFSYIIARDLSLTFNCPLVISCYDDFYLYNKNGDSLGGRIRQHHFMKVVRRTVRDSAFMLTICKSMAEKYSELFNIPCHLLYTAVDEREVNPSLNASQISYFGGLSLGRSNQLITIGKHLAKSNNEALPKYIDVYSFEKNPEILANMTSDNGIMFHGAVSQSEMFEHYSKSLAIIHVESFEEDIRERTKYSISTKIPEALSYGPCLLAYGPEGIASIDYLLENNAALVATKEQDLDKLFEELTDQNITSSIIENARKLAKKNHDPVQNHKALKSWFEIAID